MSESAVKPPSRSPYPALTAVLPLAPAACGVYLFKDAGGRVLYVGKAVKLKNRLASYLKTPDRHDAKTALMLRKLAGVDFLLTATEREALILERNLIKEHAPRYNVRLRDDKNYLCLRLDVTEEFPALRFVRRFQADGARYFGPYASGAMARETVKVMKRAFGLRTCKGRRLPPRSRPCLEHQLGQCLGPCAGLVSPEEYRRAAQEAILFLQGRAGNLIKTLKARMTEAAAHLEYEKAALLRDRLAAIRGTLEQQSMARPDFKDQDIWGVARGGGRALLLALMVRGGLVTGSREYYLPDLPAGGELLGDFLKQYYTAERPLPEEILLPQDLADRRLLAEVWSEQKGESVRLTVGQGRGGSRRARLLALAAENAQAALRRRRERPGADLALQDLQESLQLPRPPVRLECVDISTFQGGQAVGALVAFTDGVPDKSGYRRFRIREVAGQDDYAMLREVVRRHYGREGQIQPDLLVVDGGRGQLEVVRQTLRELGLETLPLAALAKAGEQGGRPVRDRLFLPGRKNPLLPPPSAPWWLLLQHLRDEAHRFAVSYHRRRARKELTASALDQVTGIGPARRKLLLTCYPDLQKLTEAPLEDLAALPGMTRQAAENLKKWLTAKK